LRAKLQYNIIPKLYFTIRADLGANEWYLADIFKSGNAIVGYGGTVSYNSFIGPVELSVMGSNIHGISAFVNLGFWF